jgi:pimeloyl-ACP methyl ester carboxylesterase
MQGETGQWVRDLSIHTPDAGHWLPIEDPAYVADRIREFPGRFGG